MIEMQTYGDAVEVQSDNYNHWLSVSARGSLLNSTRPLRVPLTFMSWSAENVLQAVAFLYPTHLKNRFCFPYQRTFGARVQHREHDTNGIDRMHDNSAVHQNPRYYQYTEEQKWLSSQQQEAPHE